MRRHRPRTDKEPRRSAGRLGAALFALSVTLSVVLSQPVLAQDQAAADPGAGGGKVITSWGISPFDKLKYPQDFKHLDYVNPDAPKGGEISEWFFGGFDSMNPYIDKGRPEVYSSVLYETMLTGVADEPDAQYCLLCKTLEYPENRSWVIFNLRHDIRFSDGKPMTAADVAFSFDLLAKDGLPSLRYLLGQQVDKVEVLDPYRIRFTFKKGYPTRDLPAAMGGLPVFSKADYEANKRDFTKSSLKPYVGSAPYVLDRLDVGQTAVYKRNPDYWGQNLPINAGRNNFDRIRIEYYADYNSAFEGFKAGNYTFRNEASSIKWATGYNFPAIEKGWVKKVALPNGSMPPGQSFIFNLRRPQFQDVRTREAIGLMFNFQWTNAKLFYGLYKRIDSFWQNTDLAASGKPGADELKLLRPLAKELPEGVLIDDAAMAPTSGPRQRDRANVHKAIRLLNAAGWKAGPDGKLRNAKGETLNVSFLNDSKDFDRIINPFVQNLRDIGVNARLEDVDDAQAKDRVLHHDFDIVTGHFSMSLTPGAELKQYFGSAMADDSIFNKMGLKDPAVDALIDDVEKANSRAELRTAVHALDRVLRALHFRIPQFYAPDHLVAYYDMYDHPEKLPPYALGELDFWWYDAKKAAALKAAGAIR